MNLVEKLIRMDKSEFTKRETKKIKSKRLSKLLGEDTEITIQAVGGKRATDIMAMCMDRNGNKDYSKTYDINIMYCVEGIIEPPMKDNTIIEHFGVKTPKDLASILFDTEVGQIATEIINLSGLGTDTEEEIKN